MYNFLLFLYLLFSLPKALFDYIFYKKKKKDLLKRLGFKSYQFNPSSKKPIIWIHAVSVGETKAAKSLLKKLKEKYPSSYIVISSITETGHIEAKKSLALADIFIFLPFDFSFTIKKVFSQINPDLIIFLETDLWPNFIKIAKKQNSKIVIASAKISERSTRRFSKLLKFSKKLFSHVDLILTQNKTYKDRFANFTSSKKIHITGNLKLTNSSYILPKNVLDEYRSKLNIKDEKVILIASTHHPEELLLINELKSISNTKILLAPRHPERFEKVYKQLKKEISISLLSKPSPNSKVILIDKMGILDILYQISSLTIVAGSFTDSVGGHNILEPVFFKTPVFFGPYMFSQIELKKIVLGSNCGKELSLKTLKNEISTYLENTAKLQELSKNCLHLQKSYQNILEGTFAKIINLREMPSQL